MKKQSESVLRLVIPDVLEIELRGKAEAVQKYFSEIKLSFVNDLAKSLSNFNGTLEMTERRRGNKLTLDVTAKGEQARSNP